MIIKELRLKHFGKFQNKSISLNRGINIIYGDNESGKSTLFWFVFGMLFGIERQRGRISREDLYSRFIPLETPSLYEGNMNIEINSRDYIIYRNFYKLQKVYRIVDIETGEEIKGNGKLYGGLNEINYKNTIAIGQLKVRTGRELTSDITNYMAGLSVSGGCEINVEKAVKSLNARLKNSGIEEVDKKLNIIKEKKRELVLINEEYNRLREEEINIQKEYEELPNDRKENIISVRKKYVFSGIMTLIGIVTALFGTVYIDFNLLSSFILILFFLILGYFIDLKKYKKKLLQGDIDICFRSEEDYINKKIDIQVKMEKIKWHQKNLESRLEKNDIIEQEYKRLLKCKEDKEKELKAVRLSINAIERSALKIKDNFGNDLNERITKIIASITNEAYTMVRLDESMNIKAGSNEGFFALEQLSTGTIEQIYLALRLSVAEFMFEDKNMPLIFDDTFAYYDDTRLMRTLELLCKDNSRQIIIMTCQNREKDMLEKLGYGFNYIKL